MLLATPGMESLPDGASSFDPRTLKPLSVSAGELSPESAARAPDRAAPRVRDSDAVDPEDPVDAEDPSELEPGEPVVSAAAIGIDATAAPTPRATASAPTRPT